MLSVFGELKHLVKYKKCLINNSTFKLHYQFTFTILCVFSLVQTLKQHLGDPILCSKVESLPKELVNSYCWIHGTFIVDCGDDGRHCLPGAGRRGAGPGVAGGSEPVSQYWYQWVIFVLFLQALCCYLPHYLWKVWEGKKISLLIQNLDSPTLDTGKESTEKAREVIVNYFYKNNRTHNLYVSKFVFCEFLNLVNILGQMYLMDVFFSGGFLEYGFNIMSSKSGDNLEKEITQVFPKIGKCTISTYGSSGTIQKHDSFCVLPLNNFNGKFYFFLWFWYLLVLCWTATFFCFRIITIASR